VSRLVGDLADCGVISGSFWLPERISAQDRHIRYLSKPFRQQLLQTAAEGLINTNPGIGSQVGADSA
jgi:hypothetical protein